MSRATQHNLPSLRSAIASKGDRLFCLLLANSPPRIGTYVALAKAIQAEGHVAVVVHPNGALPSGEELVGFESVEFAAIPFDEIPLLDGVDLFFSSEIVVDLAPPGAVTVGIFHSLPDEALSRGRFTANFAGNLRQKPTIIKTFDYLVAAVRQRSEEWTPDEYEFIQRVYPAPFLRDRRRVLDIVPGGYPKLDYSRQVLASPERPGSIMYSPTSRGSRLTRVRQDGEAVISALLEGFPERTVVFRPYPSPADIERGRALANRFAGHPRFVLDETATGVRHQRDSAAMVTDSSSSAITFALATGRPLVVVNLDLATGDPNRPEGLVENPFGLTAPSLMAMVEAVRSAVEDAPRWKRVIDEAAQEHIYNPGSASEYLAGNLHRFAGRESHPDWLSIERLPWRGTAAEAEDHVRRLRSTWSPRAGANASAAVTEITRFLGFDPGLASS